MRGASLVGPPAGALGCYSRRRLGGCVIDLGPTGEAMRRLRLRFILFLAASGALVAGTALPAGAATATKIDVCCAWNTKIADGITYSISAPSTDIANNVAAAIEEWEAAVPGLTLNPVTTRGEVTVKYKRGGGQVQGMAKRSFDRARFVTSVGINVSGSAFGNPNEPAIVAQIVKHEFGHALGANHADGDGVLMSPTVSGGSTTITGCDSDAVTEAEHWFLVDHVTTPHQPHVPSVSC